MRKILFATHNKSKVSELIQLTDTYLEILTLADLNYIQEIPETGKTLEENALQKAKTVYNTFHIPCFSDDSGLFIDNLNGEPGVNSAHYSGNRDHGQNNKLVVDKLHGVSNRNAYFKTIFCLVLSPNEYHFFEGIVHGNIATEPKGTAGFGYDPIFIPEGYSSTFGELDSKLKAQLSHRAKATQKLIKFLGESYE
jgi:XTP/dITP diphosphohydrolase